MGKKIFVSYKYADDNVKPLKGSYYSKARDYVTEFENILDVSDHIYKGEPDDLDLSKLSDDTIWEKLKDRIYDSSVTIVFISPNMREPSVPERDQWIPWEISYSLKEYSRRTSTGLSVTSRSNAMIGVVLPDRNGSYSYFLEKKTCCSSGCTLNHTERLFYIHKKNMFNKEKNASKRICDDGSTVWTGDASYIPAVKWDNFIAHYSVYIEDAVDRQNSIDEYKVCKEVEATNR